MHMVMEATKKLKYFPTQGGISKYYSPRKILYHQKLDYVKQCLIPQFTYVLAHMEPTQVNLQAARALDCLYLRPASNIQGGCELYHIPTMKTITRKSVTVIPMTDNVKEIIK